MQNNFTVGLDLGQAHDFTSLAVVERTGEPTMYSYGVRLLRRWKLGTKYPDIIADVCTMLRDPQMKGCKLVTDNSGVGRPISDAIAAAGLPVTLLPATITAGTRFSRDVDGFHVAKVLVISTLQLLLQGGRLKICNCPERETLLKELADYRVKVTPALNEVFNAREGAHDDLLFAVGLACWVGENVPDPYTGPLLLWPAPEPEPPRGTAEHHEWQQRQDIANGVVRINGREVRLEDDEADDWVTWGQRRRGW